MFLRYALLAVLIAPLVLGSHPNPPDSSVDYAAATEAPLIWGTGSEVGNPEWQGLLLKNIVLVNDVHGSNAKLASQDNVTMADYDFSNPTEVNGFIVALGMASKSHEFLGDNGVMSIETSGEAFVDSTFHIYGPARGRIKPSDQNTGLGFYFAEHAHSQIAVLRARNAPSPISNYYSWHLIDDVGNFQFVGDALETNQEFVPLAKNGDEWTNFKIDIDEGVADAAQYKIKLWLDNESEPEEWLAYNTERREKHLGIYAFREGAGSGKVYVDDFKMTSNGIPFSEANIYSIIKDTGVQDNAPLGIAWRAIVYDDDSVNIQFRASNEVFAKDSLLPVWHTVTNGQTTDFPTGRFWQWRATLKPMFNAAPILEYVEVSYDGNNGSTQYDVSNDGIVDIQDIIRITSSFGTTSGEPEYNIKHDMNNDGNINILDIISIVLNFGTQSCSLISCEAGSCGPLANGCGDVLDCGICTNSCGNNICDRSEDMMSCAEDCSTQNIVSYWPLDSTANDVIDGNDGSNTNTATVAARFDNGYEFNGNSEVRINDNNNLQNFEGTFTLWAEWHERNNFDRIISKAPSNNDGIVVSLGSSGDDQVQVAYSGFTSGSDQGFYTPVGSFPANEMHMIAFSYNSTGVNAYIDGVSVALEGAGGINFGGSTGNTDLMFGVNGEGNQAFAGVLDDVRYYDRVLTPQEINYLYDSAPIPIICGDGLIDGNETCDDGNTNNNDGCSNTCSIELCGDNIIQVGEQCDNGLQNGVDGMCSHDCLLVGGECGDGIVQSGEQCDDNNTVSGDGCSDSCNWESSGSCDGITPVQGTNLALERVASGLDKPVYVTAPSNELDRLYIVEQVTARIKILDLNTNQILPNPYLDIGNKVIDNGLERGLIGLTFHPEYATNKKFYVHYSRNNDGDSVIAEYTADNQNFAPSSSERILLIVDQPSSNHNSGQLAFGPDGYLYIGFGDGGSYNDPAENGQNVNKLLGKILRIDVNNGDPYAIPNDNPFIGSAPLDEIWSIGWRNPWRFSFDRATGDMYFGDVGQDRYEEINFEPAGLGGRNYGWDCREGAHQVGFSDNACSASATYTDPIHEYQHGSGRCSVTGGYVYNGCKMPDLVGTYIFADYCTGQVWSFEYNNAVNNFQELNLVPDAGNLDQISSFGEDARGEIYVMNLFSGDLFKIVPG